MNVHTRRVAVCGLTVGVLALGVAAILAAIADDIFLAAELIVLAAILDGFDGTLARLLRAESRFGERLDTYVDVVAFGLAPAVASYAALWADYGWWGGAAAFLIVLSGVLRFSRGCSYPSRPGRHVFRGLPIPVSATWIAVTLLVMEKDLLEVIAIDRGAALVVSWVIAFGLLVLQVSNVRYLKPSRRHLRTAMLVALALMAVTGYPLTVFCLGTAASLFVYVVGGLVRHHERVLEVEDEEEVPLAR